MALILSSARLNSLSTSPLIFSGVPLLGLVAFCPPEPAVGAAFVGAAVG